MSKRYELSKPKRIPQRRLKASENMKHDFNIDKIREEFGKLAHNIDWESQRGCMPYDWNTYGHPNMAILLDLLKIDWDGSLKSKDKKGSWRYT